MDSTKRQLTPEIIKTDKDIVINLFDELQIITSKGILTGKDLKSPKISRLIVYLLLHEGRPASPYEIVRDLWNEEDIDRAGMNVKTLIYYLATGKEPDNKKIKAALLAAAEELLRIEKEL